jgi:valyl-tRNA synthetase
MATSKENETSTKHITHWVIHALYGIVLACGGFITSQIFSQLTKLEEKVDEAPMVYVQKSDYKDDQDRIGGALEKIVERIDHNAEYMEADYNRRMDKIEKILTENLANK